MIPALHLAWARNQRQWRLIAENDAAGIDCCIDVHDGFTRNAPKQQP
jgi:hypothetical protein